MKLVLVMAAVLIKLSKVSKMELMWGLLTVYVDDLIVVLVLGLILFMG